MRVKMPQEPHPSFPVVQRKSGKKIEIAIVRHSGRQRVKVDMKRLHYVPVQREKKQIFKTPKDTYFISQ